MQAEGTTCAKALGQMPAWFEKLEGGVTPVVKWLSPKVRWTAGPEQARDRVGHGKESEFNSR